MEEFMQTFMRDVMREVKRAQAKFPSSDHMTLAVAEESGELVRAVCELRIAWERGVTVEEYRALSAEIHKEGVQTVCTIFRLLTEGDQINRVPPHIAVIDYGGKGGEP